ncbi:Ldh family oxidoreductase [Roseixanthobacter liquoris]|uniref:Ldh family oxidoreductase n=1 Tax=Roseixanthobacter liquoris TaxID=3119921 RepID=UPI003728864F
MSLLHIPADTVRRQIELILRAWGMRDDLVAQSAEVMTQTDLSGIDSHGISMLIMYEQMRRAGQINLDAVPKIVRRTASTALIDADAGLGHPAALMAMELAMEMARAQGIGWVSVFNSHHFGAAGHYVEMAARENLIGLVASSTRVVNVVPTFGTLPVLGTNPIAIAAPAGRNPAVVLDMSTSVVAANKVKIFAFNDTPVPAGWVTDAEGQSVTDPKAAYRVLFEDREGGLSAVGGTGKELGGHKGYGLGLFAQILGSTLSGGAFSPIRNLTQKRSDPDNIGHCFMALDPAAFRPLEQFHADMDALVDTLHDTPAAQIDHPVLVPGDPERRARAERLAEGIPMSPGLAGEIARIAAEAGAPFILDRVPVATHEIHA